MKHAHVLFVGLGSDLKVRLVIELFDPVAVVRQLRERVWHVVVAPDWVDIHALEL